LLFRSGEHHGGDESTFDAVVDVAFRGRRE
jgi:hypothetical protein